MPQRFSPASSPLGCARGAAAPPRPGDTAPLLTLLSPCKAAEGGAGAGAGAGGGGGGGGGGPGRRDGVDGAFAADTDAGGLHSAKGSEKLVPLSQSTTRSRQRREKNAPLLRPRLLKPRSPLPHLADPPREEEPDPPPVHRALRTEDLVVHLSGRELPHRDALLRGEDDPEDGPRGGVVLPGPGPGPGAGTGASAQVRLGTEGGRVRADAAVQEGEEFPRRGEARCGSPGVRFAPDAVRVRRA